MSQKAVSDALRPLTTINLIDPTKMTEDKEIGSNGLLYDNPGYDVCDFVGCAGETKLIGNCVKYINFYDGARNVISTYYANNGTAMDIPDGAKYFRATFHKGDAYANFGEELIRLPYGVPMSEMRLESLRAKSATKQEVEDAFTKFYDRIMIPNKVSTDFSDGWVKNAENKFSFDGEVLEIQDGGRMTATIPYKAGCNVLFAYDLFRESYGYDSAVSVSVVLKNGDSTIASLDGIQPNRGNILLNRWNHFESSITAEECAGADSIEIKIFNNNLIAQVKNPVLLISPQKALKADFSDCLTKASIAQEVADVDKTLLSYKEKSLNNTIIDPCLKRGVISTAFQSLYIKEIGPDYVEYDYNQNYSSVLLFTSESPECKREDKLIFAAEIMAVDIQTQFYVSGTLTAQNMQSYVRTQAIELTEGVKTICVFRMSLDKAHEAGFSSIPAGGSVSLRPTLTFPTRTSEVSPARIRVYRVACIKDNDGIYDNVDDTILGKILLGDVDVNAIVPSSAQSLKSGYATNAQNLIGYNPILKGKKLVTIGDSITYQSTWQEHIAKHCMMDYDGNETRWGLHFVNIATGELYDFGLTYNSETRRYYDANGVDYYPSGSIESNVVWKRYDNNASYALPLSHVSGAKYWTDSEDNKYLLAHTAKGGMAMRPTGPNAISIYEMASFAKFYRPDVIIFTGGTNDGNSTFGSADDEPYTGSLADCSEAVNGVTVCSAVKGALAKLSAENPTASIFLAVPVRGDYRNVGGDYPDVESKVRANKAARKHLEECYRAIADEYGVGLINWNSGIGITDYNLDECFKDGIHPNSFGGWLMAKEAISRML